MSSTKIDFASKRKTKTVHIAESDWEADFRLRALTAGQINDLFAEFADLRLSLIHQLAKAIVDESDNEIYTADELKSMPLNVYNALATELNKLHESTAPAVESVIKK